MWKHRANQTTSCKDCECEAAQKRQCATCDGCRQSKPNSEFSPSMLHNKARKTQRTVCNDCASEPTHQCDRCGNSKPRSGFPEAMWRNRAHNNQRTLCKDCCRPRCKATACNACKVCRQRHHKRKNCEDGIVALEKSSLPTHVDQLNTWLCSVCKSNMCSN